MAARASRGAKAVIYRPGAIRRTLPPRGAKAGIYRPRALRRRFTVPALRR